MKPVPRDNRSWELWNLLVDLERLRAFVPELAGLLTQVRMLLDTLEDADDDSPVHVED